MDQRLVRVLASFITRSSDYALARLEFGMTFPERAAPPVLDRLADASERTLRGQWETVEAQLRAADAYVKQVDGGGSIGEQTDPSFVWMKRTVRELDQYARALRWVLTVTDRDSA